MSEYISYAQLETWHLFMRAAPNVIIHILLFMPLTPGADNGNMVIEVESSHRYSVRFSFYVTDSSKGTVRQNGDWNGNVYEYMACHWIPPCEKNSIAFMLVDVCCMFIKTK